MALCDASELTEWRRFFRGLKQRRELIAQRLYTAGAHSCGDADDSNTDSTSTPIKGRRLMAASKQDDAPSPSASYTETSSTYI
jgi:hypothetical protein